MWKKTKNPCQIRANPWPLFLCLHPFVVGVEVGPAAGDDDGDGVALVHVLDDQFRPFLGQLDADDQQSLREVGIDPATVVGVPHPQLFRRFCAAIRN